MSVQNGSAAAGEGVVQERPAAGGIYASLFEKINLTPVAALSALDTWQDAQAMSEATADERLTAGMQVFLECLTRAGSKVEKLDKHLIDHHIAELDWQISRQLDAVMHHEAFQATESLWRGVKSLVDKTDFRQNVKIELLDMSKEDLRQDFEDSPEIIQSGLYKHTYIDEYDTPGGEPVAALISAYEFDASAQDVALLRSISKVSAAAHMPFIGSAGPKFFLKESMEEVAAIRDIGNYFDRAEYIKWKSFRETDDTYVPFSGFRHKGGMMRHEAPEYYYHTRVRRGPSGLHNTWLILGGEAFDNHTAPEDESLSLTLTGTNGQLPRRALQSTVLDTVMKTTSASIAVLNLCAPTLPCYPPAQDRFHWRVLSHLGSGFLSMMDNADVLRGTLALYEWTDSEMNRRRLEAIIDVKHSETERFEQGYLVRGVQIEVTLDSHGFAGRGDICLFGEMLSRFFALYTDIYLFNRLIIILQPTGERLQWEEKHNRRIPG